MRRTGIHIVNRHGGHNHLPSPAAVKIMIDTYLQRASSDRPPRRRRQPGVVHRSARQRVCAVLRTAGHARGGDVVLEQPCGLGPSPCQFQAFPGTVGWLANFMSYSKLHFDAVRDDLFHWVFYTHARGKPKSELPCLNAQAQPVPAASNGTCAVGPNPDFHVPSGSSGVAQLPGNKAMISVGLWDTTNHVGSAELVASTTLHELGHNGELWHGDEARSGIRRRGFASSRRTASPDTQRDELPVPGPRNAGRKTASRTTTIRGTSTTTSTRPTWPTVSAPGPPLRFRTAWYVPLVPGTLAYALDATPARRFCNGAKFPNPAAAGLGRHGESRRPRAHPIRSTGIPTVT